MIWNPELKREIPEGWLIGSLAENPLSELIKPGIDKFIKKNYLATANINLENINDGEWINFENRASRANMQPIANSVWFAKMKGSIKHLTLPASCEWFTNKYILSTGFCGIKCSDISLAYFHCIINSDSFEIIKDSLAHGATQQAVNNDDLKSIRIVIPPDDILKKFSSIVEPLLQKKISILKECPELASLQNWLLPMLMNRQITVE